MALIVYRADVLRVFGESFVLGTEVLLIFTLAQVVNSAAGPSGLVLMMTDHQYVNLVNQWVFGVMNIVLNYVLIRELGLIGAATATGIVLVGINLVRIIEVWYLEGLFPYNLSFWKPIVAAGLVTLVMKGLETVFDGYLLLAVGGTVGPLMFLVLLWQFGIENEVRELFRGLWHEWQEDSA